MGFQINPNRRESYRKILSERDKDYLNNCKTCPYTDICGGWSLQNDARNCVGPGDVCLGLSSDGYPLGCRAICSRSPIKVEEATVLLGDGHFYLNPNYSGESGKGHAWDLEVYPDLSISDYTWGGFSHKLPPVGFVINDTIDFPIDFALVSLKRLFYPKHGTWSKTKDLRARFGVARPSLISIAPHIGDLYLDQLSDNLDAFAEGLSSFSGPDFAFVPNFSIYDNYPRLDTLFQLKKKWIMMDLLQRRGLQVIPDISVINRQDFLRQASWMKKNSCDVMFMNFQLQSSRVGGEQWKKQLKIAIMIRDHVGLDVRLIAAGVSGGARLKDLFVQYGPKITVIDSRAYRLAEFRKDIFEKRIMGISPIRQFEQNVRDLTSVILDLQRGS